jgi:hypothetical protein
MMSEQFSNNPPPEFSEAHELKKLTNVTFIKGSVLDRDVINRLKGQKIDLVFTCMVLENLNNYLDLAFDHIFSLNIDYFLFYENWLEANYSAKQYSDLVRKDYFRASWKFLNRFPAQIIEQTIPTMQADHIRWASVFGRKKSDKI